MNATLLPPARSAFRRVRAVVTQRALLSHRPTPGSIENENAHTMNERPLFHAHEKVGVEEKVTASAARMLIREKFT